MPGHRLLLSFRPSLHHHLSRTDVVRRALRRTGWWLAGVATATVLASVNPVALQLLDLLAYDLVIPTRQASPEAPVVVAIDDASLAALGRWPWPRDLYAALIHRLGEADAAAVGLAVLFAEPDLPDPSVEAALLSASLRHGRVVMGGPAARGPAISPVRDPRGPLYLADLGGFNGTWQVMHGQVNVDLDVDGKARGLFVGSGADSPRLPALAKAVLDAISVPVSASNGEASISSGLHLDGWLRQNEVLLPRTVGIPVIPFVQALRSPETIAAKVAQRTVFVGVTATGLGAQLNTPLASPRSLLPTVLFQAQAFDVLQDRAAIRRANAALVFFLALFTLGVLALWPPDHGHRVMLAVLLLFLPIALSAWLVAAAQVWLSPALATVSLAVAMACWLVRRLQRTHRKLRRARRHAEATLQAIDDAVITVDARDQRIRFVNATVLHQADGQALVGRPLHTAYPLSPDSMGRVKEAVADCMARRAAVHLPALLRLHGATGPRALRAKASPVYSPGGQLDGVVLVFADVTDTVAATSKLDRAAKHDALTGLPNRSQLQERLALALSRVQRQGSQAAILFLDLDNFKHINDSLGHRAGDQVLKLVSERLSALCRDTDTVARWGGDEFVLVFEDVGGQDGAATATAKVVEVLSQDIVLGPEFDHLRVLSAASVGVVLAPRDGMDMEELLAKADTAMYRAKAQAGACFQFWSNGMEVPMRDRSEKR